MLNKITKFFTRKHKTENNAEDLETLEHDLLIADIPAVIAKQTIAEIKNGNHSTEACRDFIYQKLVAHRVHFLLYFFIATAVYVKFY
jgi:signal recognition particle GTPase